MQAERDPVRLIMEDLQKSSSEFMRCYFYIAPTHDELNRFTGRMIGALRTEYPDQFRATIYTIRNQGRSVMVRATTPAGAESAIHGYWANLIIMDRCERDARSWVEIFASALLDVQGQLIELPSGA